MEMVNVKAMPRLIPTPNPGSLMEKKIRKIAKWGKPTKKSFVVPRVENHCFK
jgi:hypothetical protein